MWLPQLYRNLSYCEQKGKEQKPFIPESHNFWNCNLQSKENYESDI